MSPKPETIFLLKRAEEEAIRAISAAEPVAAEAHQRLSRLYSTKAVLALVAEEPPMPKLAD